MKNLGVVFRYAFTVALILSCICVIGCNRSSNKSQHGASQNATQQDKQKQNRNLIDQVVLAVEHQEDYPDPAYLRGALGRLNSWLAEYPPSEDFEPDEEFASLAEKFGQLSKDARRLEELVRLFADESKTPEEKDGTELQQVVETVETQTNELAEKMSSVALKSYGLFFADLKKQLSSAKEFQFADATETFQTQVREFVKRPSGEFYNCEAFVQGIEDFRRLLLVDGKTFLPQDADYLRSTIWYRDIFSWAKGKKQDDFTIVKNLFDWSVRNIVITPHMPGPTGMPMEQLSWQTLLLSQGTAMDRAVVFMELLRQHRLDSFVLRQNGQQREDFPLVVGVSLNNEVYLFLPGLGLPIPGPEENALTLEEGLQFNSVATLNQVASDDALLRQFDLSDKPFPATSKDFESMVAYVPSTPFTVAARMIPMEQEFSSKVTTALSTTFGTQKERISRLDRITGVQRLFEATTPVLEQALFPYESEDLTAVYMISSGSGGNLEVTDSSDSSEDSTAIEDYTNSSPNDSQQSIAKSAPKAQKAALWTGKNLYIRGLFIDDNGASRHFLQGRISERLLKQEEASINQKVNAYLRNYAEDRASRNQAPSQEELQAIGQEYASMLQMDIVSKRYIKIMTSFYLALLSEAAGNDSAALDRLNDETLRLRPQTSNTKETRSYGDDFRYAANYLRARILEKQGNIETAIDRLKADSQNTGNFIRAMWLAKLIGKSADGNLSQQDPSAESAEPEKNEPSTDEATSSTEEPKIEVSSEDAIPETPTSEAQESQKDSEADIAQEGESKSLEQDQEPVAAQPAE